MSKPLIGIVVGAFHGERFGDVPAHWIYRLAERRADLRIELIDVGNDCLPFFDGGVRRVPANDGAASARRWAAVLDRLDGFIVVTPEGGPCAAAARAEDIERLRKEFADKPVAFVGYGTSDDVPDAVSRRSLAFTLQMVPIGRAVHLRRAELMGIRAQANSFDDFPHLAQAAAGMLDDLAWWAHAMQGARQPPALAAASSDAPGPASRRQPGLWQSVRQRIVGLPPRDWAQGR